MTTDKEKEDFKSGAEKLLNILGKKMDIKYYGYDGNYTVDDEWWESLCDDDKLELNKTYS